ncbi:MAG: YdcF family protein [Myxococcales bacterium]|nr:YdcF family protein [Myxococcales bacterium]MDP3499716.1 YdcF family protein [Myxococcales bacterium]
MTPVLLLLAVVPLAVSGLALRVHRFGRRRVELSPRQAIVVLGARVLPDGTPSEALVARVQHAVALHRAGAGATLVFSGAGPGAVSEAEVARQLAIAAGVAAEVCLLEPASHSTFDNARRTVELLRDQGLSDVWLVTDDFHAWRAVAHFRRAGLLVWAAPVTRALSVPSRLKWTLREVAALVRRPWLLR